MPVKRVLVQNLTLNIAGSEGHTQQAEESKAVGEALRQTAGDTLINLPQPHWGMAYQRVKKGLYKVAVVMDQQNLELDPLPRKLSAGESAPLSGRVLPPYKNPHIRLSDERGKETNLDPIPGDAFKGELRCGPTPGELWVEVQAERDGHPAPVAAFSVACGRELPVSVALEAAAWPTDGPGQEHRLADGINAQREAAGIPGVEWDDKLSSVARAVAETIRDQVGRGEAPAVDLGQLLEKAGIASALVLQNPAQARSAEEAEHRFTASPSNRQNILNSEVNRVGVGIAPGEGSAKSTVFVVEIFTKVLAVVDPQAVKRNLYASIEKRRTGAGAEAAAVDPKLEKVAQEYAEASAQVAGKLSDDDASEITHGIRIAYKSISMVDGAKADPIAFSEDQTVLSPGSSIGIGVARGDHPVLGKNALYVAILLGTARTPDAAKPPPTPAKPATKPATKPAKPTGTKAQ